MEKKVNIIGEKLGMTQVFNKEENIVPVTVVKAFPGTVIQIKTKEKDGYSALRIAFLEWNEKKLKKPDLGIYKKLKLPANKYIREFRIENTDNYKIGDKILPSQFVVGDLIDVVGVSKGKGFQGVVKKYGFAGGPKTRGQSDRWRAPGAQSSGTSPGRVFKGKRMPGRMGGDIKTIQRLKIVEIDNERNLILIEGAIPGKKNSIVSIRESSKKVK